MFLNQGTSQPEASQEEKVNGDILDMEFVEELDDVQLATVVGGVTVDVDVNSRRRQKLLSEALTALSEAQSTLTAPLSQQ